MQVLTFNLGQEIMGLDISCVREVIKPQEIHPLPQAPEFIEGVIDLRDHIIAVMDLRKKLEFKVKEERPKMRIIICRVKKFVIGLLVDSIIEVISLSKGQLQPEPEVVSGRVKDSYILGIAKGVEKVIFILDLEKILSEEEADRLSGYKS